MVFKIISVSTSNPIIFKNTDLQHILTFLEELIQIPNNPFQSTLQPFIELLKDIDPSPTSIWEKFANYTNAYDENAATLSIVLTKKININNRIIQKYLDQKFSIDQDDTFLDGLSTPSYSDQGSSGSRGSDIPPSELLGVINPRKRGDNFLTLKYTDQPHYIQQSSTVLFGDKLYGNQENRDTLLPSLEKKFGSDLSYRDALTIDEYNELLNISSMALNLGQYSDKTEAPNFKLPEDHDIDHPQALVFKRFSVEFLNAKGKFFSNDTTDRIKKSCKLGIDFNHNKGKKIRFILPDGARLDQKSIVLKDGGKGQSITASELRKVYRQWDTLSNTVVFYREVVDRGYDSDNSRKSEFVSKTLETTAAPWETEEGRELWSQYEPKKAR